MFRVKSDQRQMAADWHLTEIIVWKTLPSSNDEQIRYYFPSDYWLKKGNEKSKPKRPEIYSHPHGNESGEIRSIFDCCVD
jgi:hypothetical protein